MDERVMNMFNRLDSTTYNHSVRVMAIATEIEEFLSINDNYLSSAALLHDIGKIYIPHAILDKVGRLDDIEREIIDLHPYIGYRILNNAGINEKICRIVLFHHGFNPATIQNVCDSNDQYVIEMSKLLHSIDVFEALTSDRPYHRGVPAREALRIMENDGTHHPEVIKYISHILNGAQDDSSAIHRFQKNESNDMFYHFINTNIENMSLVI